MKNIFGSLGIDDRELAVFLALLEYGAQPVSVIAKQMGIPRSTMYSILENLEDTELIEAFERKGIKYFKCIPVDDIVDVFKNKRRKSEEALDVFYDHMEELMEIENRLSITPHVRLFEGKEAVIKAYKTMLKSHEEGTYFYAFLDPRLVKTAMPEFHFEIPEMIKRHDIPAKEIFTDCHDAREYRDKYESKTHQIKLLPQDTKLASETVLWKDKIYMFSYGKDDVSAVEIGNRSFVESLKGLFEIMWDRI